MRKYAWTILSEFNLFFYMMKISYPACLKVYTSSCLNFTVASGNLPPLLRPILSFTMNNKVNVIGIFLKKITS